MPQPLPDAMVATLKADPCAALAAIMIVANAHSELLAWAQRSDRAAHAIVRACARSATGGKEDANANGAGVGNGVAKRHGAKKAARANGHHSAA